MIIDIHTCLSLYFQFFVIYTQKWNYWITDSCLIFVELPFCFPQQLYHCTFPQAMHRSFSLSTSSTLVFCLCFCFCIRTIPGVALLYAFANKTCDVIENSQILTVTSAFSLLHCFVLVQGDEENPTSQQLGKVDYLTSLFQTIMGIL